MTPSTSPPRQVLVRRLLRVYDPWENLSLPRHGYAARVMAADPIADYVPHGERAPSYDAGRIRWLMLRLRVNTTTMPIEIDNAYNGFGDPIEVVVQDGHHRLIAAHYAKRETIPAVVGGWVAMAEWLCGERRRMPEWGKR